MNLHESESAVGKNSAWYALRRTIPIWYADEGIAELVEFCKQNFIDEVIIKVDTEEFSHGIPTVEWLDGYMPILHRVKKELTQIGVVFSINPWVTLVHRDQGRDISAIHPDVQSMVGHDGAECKTCSCPISDGWRNITRELWHRYASTEPDVLWVEDDIRLLNHSPVDYGCFCPLHIKEFSRRIGRNVTREELVKAILAPGEPHLWRSEWLDLNRELANDTVAFIERTVHEVSPNTKLGLMCSGPNSHALEGRDWASFTRSLAGNQQLVARPSLGVYSEHGMRDIYYSASSLRSTLHCLGPGINIQTELENFTFSTYAKSATTTFNQLALSFIYGADGVTMNLFDHLGTPLDVTPEFGMIIREKKAFLNSLADRCRGGKSLGIRLIHNAEGSRHIKLQENADYTDLFPEGQAWTTALEPMGFPVSYNDSAVTAVNGQVLRGLPDTKIKELLSGGIIMDLSALRTLIDMGYGEYVGVSIKREFLKNSEPLAAEEYFEPEFGGEQRKYLTMFMGGRMLLAEIVPASGAKVISRLVDADTNPCYPFATAFENSLGGRVAVYPVEFDSGIFAYPAFLNPYRKQQLENIVRWLGRGPAPLQVSGGVYPLPFVVDHEDYSIVGAFNLSLDEWPNVIFDMPGNKTPSRIEAISEDGSWKEDSSISWSASGDGLRIDMSRPLGAMSLTVLTVWWK